MKTWLLSLLLLVGVFVLAGETTETTNQDELQTLTGTLREALKSEFKYYLEIEGTTEKMNLTGEILKNFKPGKIICVKGIIKTKLWNDGTSQRQLVHWIIFMEVQEVGHVRFPRPGTGNQ